MCCENIYYKPGSSFTNRLVSSPVEYFTSNDREVNEEKVVRLHYEAQSHMFSFASELYQL